MSEILEYGASFCDTTTRNDKEKMLVSLPGGESQMFSSRLDPIVIMDVFSVLMAERIVIYYMGECQTRCQECLNHNCIVFFTDISESLFQECLWNNLHILRIPPGIGPTIFKNLNLYKYFEDLKPRVLTTQNLD